MSFGWLSQDLPEDQFRAVVLHEFGHALGLIHEHPARWNRPALGAGNASVIITVNDVIERAAGAAHDDGPHPKQESK